MVDNQNKYNKARFKILVSGVPAIICSLFLPKKKGRIILNSHFNESFDFNSKYLFLYLLNKGYDAWYVVNNSNSRKKLIERYGNHFIETKSFKGKIFALRSKLWFVSAFEMPVGGMFLNIGRTVVHLTHGSLIKNVGILEKNVSLIKKIYYKFFIRTNISYSVATSDFFVPSTAGYTGLPRNKILITGFPRNDELFNQNSIIPNILRNDSFKILYAPTWRKDADVRLFPIEDFNLTDFNVFLRENNIIIYIRLHPYNEVSIGDNILQTNIQLFSTSECKEIMDCMKCFDGLITDYSSILYDFLILNRPLLFFPYDYDEYEQKVGFAVDYSMITPGYKPKTFAELKQVMLDMKEKDSLKEKRERINKLCNKYQNNSSERIIRELKRRNLL